MQIIETTNEGLKKGLKIILPGSSLAEQVNKRLLEIGKTIRLPGFRVGKVPLNVLKTRYEAAVYGEVLDKAIQESCEKALKEKKIQPVAQPKVEFEKLDKGEDVEFTIEVETLPEIKDIDFKNIKIEKPVAKVKDSQVKEALEKVADQRREKTELKKARAVKKGDMINFDFEGKIDGVAFPGGTAQGFELEIGSGQFIPGFEDQVVGKKIGEEADIKVTFPEEYGAKDLAGKDAIFTIKVHKIFEMSKPKLDDDFAKNLGAPDLKAVKEDIRKKLQSEYEEFSFAKAKRQVLDQLADSSDFEVPETLINQEFDQIWAQIEQDKENGRLDEEDAKKSDEELKEDYKEISVRRIRLGLVLADIGTKNKINVTQDEINKKVNEEANRFPQQREQIIKIYQERPELLNNIRGPLFEDKVVDFILTQAKVSDKEVDLEELLKPVEEDIKPKKTKKAAAKKKPAAKKEEKPKAETKKKAAAKKPAAKKTTAKASEKKDSTAKKKTAKK